MISSCIPTGSSCFIPPPNLLPMPAAIIKRVVFFIINTFYFVLFILSICVLSFLSVFLLYLFLISFTVVLYYLYFIIFLITCTLHLLFHIQAVKRAHLPTKYSYSRNMIPYLAYNYNHATNCTLYKIVISSKIIFKW